MFLSIVSFVSFFLFCGRKEKEILVSKHIGIRTYILHEKFAGGMNREELTTAGARMFLHLSPLISSHLFRVLALTYHKTLNFRNHQLLPSTTRILSV